MTATTSEKGWRTKLSGFVGHLLLMITAAAVASYAARPWVTIDFWHALAALATVNYITRSRVQVHDNLG